MARARGDNSETTLSNYSHKLQNSFFIEDMKRSPKMTKYYAKNPDADLLASKTVNRLAYEYFSIGLETDTEKIAKMTSIVKDMQHPFKTMGDLYYGIKDWSV
jgi:electron transfer flavoprotein-quinone oxidoreductase